MAGRVRAVERCLPLLAGLPTGFLSAVVRGNTMVTVPPGTYVAGGLQVGVRSGDNSRVDVDGGQLVLM